MKRPTCFNYKTLACLNLIFFAASALLASPGNLDPSFGNGGRVITTTQIPGNSGIKAIAVQPDGKTIVVGNGANFFLSRYNLNGTPDSSFGTNGIVYIPFSANVNSYSTDVAVQPDGKIVVVGSARVNDLASLAVARYNGNGTFDTSFGNQGRYTLTLTTRPEQSAALLTVDLQNDGKIVAASGSKIIRLNSDGTLDSDFGTNGVYTTSMLGLIGNILSQSDRKTLIAGNVYFNDGIIGDAIIRLDEKGVPDTGFGQNGTVVVNNTGGNFDLRAIALQSNGKIIAAGNFYRKYWDVAHPYPFPLRTYNPPMISVARFDQNGVVDTTFGNNGWAIYYSRKYEMRAEAVAIQPNDNIVVCGSTINLMKARYLPQANWDADFILARFDANGIFDQYFGINGLVSTDFGNNFSEGGTAVGIQPDGKIVAGGGYLNGNPSYYFILARYLNQ